MRVAIVGEFEDEGLSHQTYDLLLKIKNLSQGSDPLEIDLILPDCVDHCLEAFPCHRVFVYKKVTGNHDVARTVDVIKHYCINNKPSLVLVANDKADEIIPKALVKINADSKDSPNISSFLNCDEVLFDEKEGRLIIKKLVYGGNVMAHYNIKTTTIISLKESKKTSKMTVMNKPEIIFVNYTNHFDMDFILKREHEVIKNVGLEEANVVVVVGRGLASKEAVEKVVTWATSIGAVVGGTKKVIDYGWLPIHQLIGQTGHTIAPKLCLVIGASGARPFINGIIDSKKIIAINKDKNARIFDYADIGIVEDYSIVLDELYDLDVLKLKV